MRKIVVLQICAGMLLMSGCSSTGPQEISEITSTTTFTVICKRILNLFGTHTGLLLKNEVL